MDRNFHSLACLSGSGSAASVSSWACWALADSPHALHFCFFSSKNSKGCALHRSGSSIEHALSVDPNAFGGKLNGSNSNNTGTCQTNQPKTFKTSDFRICWTYIHGSFQGGLGRDLLPSPTQDLPRSIYHGFGETAWAERDAARLMVPSAPSSPRAPSVLEVPAGAAAVVFFLRDLLPRCFQRCIHSTSLDCLSSLLQVFRFLLRTSVALKAKSSGGPYHMKTKQALNRKNSHGTFTCSAVGEHLKSNQMWEDVGS